MSSTFDYVIHNFTKMKSIIFNLGLKDVYLTKIILHEIIEEYKKNSDQRAYFVSNEKFVF